MFANTSGYLVRKVPIEIVHVAEDLVRQIDLDRVDPINVFRVDASGAVKQVQHLERLLEFREVGGRVMRAFGVEGDIINMQVFYKAPGAAYTKPHQDGAYFGGANYLTFWIPLQPVGMANSCLWYLDHSFERGALVHAETGSTFRVRTGVAGRSLEYVGELVDYTPVIMEKGEVVCHHPYTLHYSSTNTTQSTRVALTCIVRLREDP